VGRQEAQQGIGKAPERGEAQGRQDKLEEAAPVRHALP
jgi:hypothetical protein